MQSIKSSLELKRGENIRRGGTEKLGFRGECIHAIESKNSSGIRKVGEKVKCFKHGARM